MKKARSKIRKIDEKARKVVLPTGVKSVDYVLGGGLRLGSVYVIYGRFGAGKTTLAMQMLDGLARSGSRSTYVSDRPNVEICRRAQQQLGITSDLIAVSDDPTSWEKIETSVVVLDWPRALYCAKSIERTRKTAYVIVVQETKAGGLRGPVDGLQYADVVLWLGNVDRALGCWRDGKNRYADPSRCGIFVLGKDGKLEEA